jgi:transposase
VVLPPYSPALNPAERVCHAIRRVVEGRVYATPTDKQAAVERSLERLDADPERVRSLLNWHWLTVALA